MVFLNNSLRQRGDLPCPHVHALLTHGLAESKIDRHAGAARTLTKGSSSVMLQNGAHAGPLDLVVRWDSRAQACMELWEHPPRSG